MLFFRDKTDNVIMRICCIYFVSNMPRSREEDVKYLHHFFCFYCKIKAPKGGEGSWNVQFWFLSPVDAPHQILLYYFYFYYVHFLSKVFQRVTLYFLLNLYTGVYFWEVTTTNFKKVKYINFLVFDFFCVCFGMKLYIFEIYSHLIIISLVTMNLFV